MPETPTPPLPPQATPPTDPPKKIKRKYERRGLNSTMKTKSFHITHPRNPSLGFLEIKDARKRQFLIEFVKSHAVEKSAELANISRQSIYIWRKQDTKFALAFERAENIYKERLEAEAYRRAVDGNPTGIWYKGMRVGEEKQYSDELLAKMLKANIPEKYGDSIRVGGTGEPIKVANLNMNLDSPEARQLVDKLLLDAYRKSAEAADNADAGGEPSGTGEGGKR